ncbi:MAG: caspase family protein [Planctomycetaceae bacterium]
MLETFRTLIANSLRSRSTGASLLAWLMMLSGAQASEQVSSEIDSPQRFALLVGVQRYPQLDASEQLRGARNDVHAIAQSLVERFHIPSEHIRILLDEDATAAAIRAEFDALVQRVSRLPPATSVQVVFHFSGHGSQIEDQATGIDADEPDGLDETLVPYDATRQGSDEDIRDDELNAFAHRLCARELTRLWMILDCCHSGTGVRGAAETRFRALDRRLPELSERERATRKITEKKLPVTAIALYACQAIEKEPEYQEGTRVFGLLTRCLTQVLHETSNLSKLSYSLLVKAIESRYRQDRRIVPAPTPTIEGSPGWIVCDADSTLDRPPVWKAIPSPSDRGEVRIDAGLLQGMTAGSVFQLYRDVDSMVSEKDESVGWLRVVEVDMVVSTARVYQRDGQEWFESRAPNDLKLGWALERYHDHGENGACVRVVFAIDDQQDSPPLPKDAPDIPAGVHSAFDMAGRDDESRWLRWATPDDRYDLVLRIDGPYAAIFPAIAMGYVDPVEGTRRADLPLSLRGGWGPFDLRRGRQAGREIQETIRRITRARNLIRLVDLQQTSAEASKQVRLTLERLDVRDGAITARQPWVPEGANGDPSSLGIEVSDGQFYDWRVSYDDSHDMLVYVTLLQVDSNYGIQVILPTQIGAESPRLDPGDSITAGGFECCRDDQGIAQLGPRWTIALTTSAPNHYSWLTQDSLPIIRGIAPASWMNSKSNRSRLDDLLMGEMYFASRGDWPSASQPMQDDSSWHVELRKWQAVSQQELP